MAHIENIMVVGGGTSGWLTAAILARKFHQNPNRNIQVTLLESSDIPTIGVGEGTFPTMLNTLQYIGIEESEFLKSCQATFKQGIKFVDWLKPPSGDQHSHYYHLFNPPVLANGVDVTREWLAYEKDKPGYSYAVSPQAYICDQNLAPKRVDTGDYRWKTKYAYHLDAGKFVELLKRFATENLNVKHVIATVGQVEQEPETGNISAVVCEQGIRREADFFVDCTGFASLLIGKTLDSPFVDKSDVLFVDKAIAMQVPYLDEKQAIASHTISTAHEAGWSWDIGLKNRRGIGYVYASNYTSGERAEQVLRNYVGSQADNLDVKKISMRVGYREECWRNNCVAIGFSGGFVEPLEATAISMVETGATLLADQFPEDENAIPAIATKYNQIFKLRWEKIVEFIKLHYCLSQRTDSQFWIDNVKSTSIPKALLEKINLWRYFPPVENDFASRFEMFTLASYQYILYGMEFKTELQSAYLSGTRKEVAEMVFSKIHEQGSVALKDLPDHRELIETLNSSIR
ncbi:tryptophan halogenase family protein [Aliikangiella coralliicola]|uniref:Tryptophan 7-halogenase n=1 Tax=Aliikangiella coralliicola TaxID=2592383 RepID=A0A545UHN5_9GAMM|nr:tryptophan halogenase family protein [Aliikangiella coralliicola]TQV88923.1 tryptophan 7-halogenase [Aliikangiella coralliicola]